MSKARELAIDFFLGFEYERFDALTQQRKLLEIIDARFAELREKEKGDHVGERTEMVAGEWEPTAKQIAAIDVYVSGPSSRREAVRSALIAGHRITMEKCKCSQCGSSVTSSPDLQPQGSCADTTFQTKPSCSVSDSGSCSSSSFSSEESPAASRGSSAKSLDDRAEALFVKHPEWRPQRNGRGLILTKSGWGFQTTRELQQVAPDCGQALLVKALLPRAIGRWWNRWGGAPGCPVPPSTLISAITILENA